MSSNPLAAGISHQAVVLRVGDPEIEYAVAVDIGKDRSHRGS